MRRSVASAGAFGRRGVSGGVTTLVVARNALECVTPAGKWRTMGASVHGASAMATTLPGAPHPDESELDTLPVEPEFAPVTPEEPSEGEHEPVPKPAQ
jgi:hypothetical protein